MPIGVASRGADLERLVGRLSLNDNPLAPPSDLERRDQASVRLPTVIGLDNDLHVQATDAPHKPNHNVPEHTAQLRGLGRDLEVEVYRRGQQDLIMLSDASPIGTGRITRMTVTLANGDTLPPWMKLTADGMLTLDRPVGADHIELRVTVERENSYIRSHIIRIEPNAVSVVDPDSRIIVGGASTFGEQLHAAAQAVDSHQQLMAALG
jgi:hypothetical protein